MHTIDVTQEYGRLTFHQNTDRSPGVHASSLIKHFLQHYNLWEYADQQEVEEEERARSLHGNVLFNDAVTARICLGLAWEQFLEKHSPHFCRPGELVLDGIALSPDALSETNDEHKLIVLHEIKLTWRSARRRPEDNTYWRWQVASYIKATGAAIALQHCFHVNGLYEKNRIGDPMPMVSAWVFTQEEINNMWAALLAHHREFGHLIKKG